MKVSIRRWGNSLAVRIPKLFVLQLGIDDGQDMQLSLTEENALVLSKSEEDLSALLKQVTPDNVHAYTETHDPIGNEVW